MAIAITQIAQSYFLMKEVGYYYSRDEISNISYKFKNKKCKPNLKLKGTDSVKFLHFLVEKTRNNKIERQMLYHEIISMNYYYKFSSIKRSQFHELYKIYDIIINSRFISKKQKERIKLLKVELKSKEK